MREKRLPEALAEARQAVSLAPDAVKPNVVLGNVLTALQQPEDARHAYEKALALAKTIEPEFQVGWIPTLEHKLARN
jgi:Flp pilus assembly protein TadD